MQKPAERLYTSSAALGPSRAVPSVQMVGNSTNKIATRRAHDNIASWEWPVRWEDLAGLFSFSRAAPTTI